MNQPITYEYLRSINFRILSTNVSPSVHLLWRFDNRMDLALEVAESGGRTGRDWIVWLRSDLAHSRCRFCFVRCVETQEQIERLIEAITDRPVERVDFDRVQFEEALAEERVDAKRRYAEYCRDDRWGYYPS